MLLHTIVILIQGCCTITSYYNLQVPVSAPISAGSSHLITFHALALSVVERGIGLLTWSTGSFTCISILEPLCIDRSLPKSAHCFQFLCTHTLFVWILSPLETSQWSIMGAVCFTETEQSHTPTLWRWRCWTLELWNWVQTWWYIRSQVIPSQVISSKFRCECTEDRRVRIYDIYTK